MRVNLYNDAPQFYLYRIDYELLNNNKTIEGTALGCSFDQKQALIRVIGETVERIALKTSKTTLSSTAYTELKNDNFMRTG